MRIQRGTSGLFPCPFGCEQRSDRLTLDVESIVGFVKDLRNRTPTRPSSQDRLFVRRRVPVTIRTTLEDLQRLKVGPQL